MTRGLTRLGTVLAIGLAVAACSPTVISPLPSPSAPAAVAAASATDPTGAPTSTPVGGTTVAIDPSLLEILPATVDGVEVLKNADGEAAALGDPLLAQVGRAVAAGLAIEPASGDFVYVVVVRLLPDVMDDTVFQDWRDSFDEGACSQAGGVGNHAETEIGGRTVYIGTCAGDLLTYHVWLEDRGVLISASAVGERRFGELLVANLRL